jgi:hypothetical protein
MKTITLLSMFGLGVLLVAGCTSSATVGMAQTTSVEIRPMKHIAIESATYEITGARCAKAEQCGDVGKGFKSLGACETAVRRDVRDELLETTRCNWIEAGQLSACLDAIRASDCAGPTTSVQGLESCRALWMCR